MTNPEDDAATLLELVDVPPVPEPRAGHRGSRLRVRDLASEALAGVVQRPSRTLLTALGTLLGVGAFVSVLGLTSSASAQIDQRFTVLAATTVTVTDAQAAASAGTGGQDSGNPPVSFPVDADRRIESLNGVAAAGVWWRVPLKTPSITTVPGGEAANGQGLEVYAATAGAVAAMDLAMDTGTGLDRWAVDTHQHVALLSQAAATRLGLAASQVNGQQAVYLNGIPYTVLGIYHGAERISQTLLGLIIPTTTALDEFGNPDAGTDPAQMVIATRLGAAQLVARQAALALSPQAPTDFGVTAPPDPQSLRNSVTSDLAGLFLALAGVSLAVGAFGIANTTLVAVMERIEEIGLRRALGARPRDIAAQFLAESTLIGTLGGLVGTGVGVLVVLGVAESRHWTAVLQPAVTLPSPLIGSVVGLLAGLYPAVRASMMSPLAALRHG